MSALGELVEALRQVEERLDQVRGQLVQSRKSLAEAQSALAGLDPEHPETVVPPGLRRADDQIERTQGLVDHAVDTLRGFVTQL
ncbi:hypothetical protein [Saccharopolyspora taberi]|uniref:Uncharacterized protein n=1 Tax=Saccharopolyspora taberi TaxID=60895 RepID=A0ABN3V8X3_9PSEU